MNDSTTDTTTLPELLEAHHLKELFGLPNTGEVFRLASLARIPAPCLRLTRRIARWRRDEVLAFLKAQEAA
jgi:hypothetical protein